MKPKKYLLEYANQELLEVTLSDDAPDFIREMNDFVGIDESKNDIRIWLRRLLTEFVTYGEVPIGDEGWYEEGQGIHVKVLAKFEPDADEMTISEI